MFEKERESIRRQGKWVWFLFVPLFCIVSYCVCGMGAALTIPAFINYTRGSKAAEATTHLATLSAAMEAACAGDGGALPRGFPPSVGPIPLAPREDRQTFVAEGTFVQLQFVPEPVYYSYSIVTPSSGGETSTLLAEGDLDGDGRRSRYVVECRIASGVCDCDSEPTIEDALE